MGILKVALIIAGVILVFRLIIATFNKKLKKPKETFNDFLDFCEETVKMGWYAAEGWTKKNRMNWTIKDLKEGKVGWNLKYKKKKK